MGFRLPALVAFCNHHLDDAAGRKQAPESMACRSGESGAVAGVDCFVGDMGNAANEFRSLVRLRQESHEMEG